MLRDYQSKIGEFERLVACAVRSVLVTGPDGSGNTVIASALVAPAAAPIPVGNLGKLHEAPAVTTIRVPRIHYLARRIHLLGERPPFAIRTNGAHAP